MLGEIRDKETADITKPLKLAIWFWRQCAQTHLPETITRLKILA